MRFAFRPREIFAIACQLERDGAAFYRRAAETVGEPETAALLLELARMEDNHLRDLQELEKALLGAAGEEMHFDTDIALRYLRAFSIGHVVDFSPDLEAHLAECEGPADILLAAIKIEKDSVALYAGIQSMALGHPGWHAARAILFEELGHIASLSERLEALR